MFLSLGIQIPSKKVVWGVFRRLNTSQKVLGSIGFEASEQINKS